MIISLIGFMAAGKTKVGEHLASVLKCPFIDLDALVEEKEDMSISEIFEKKGENYFREKELEYFEDLMEEYIMKDSAAIEELCAMRESNTADIPKNCTLLISLGGGSVMNDVIADLIRRFTYCIYLKADVKSILARLSADGEVSKRPLLSGSDDLYSTITRLYAAREPIYSDLADKILEV